MKEKKDLRDPHAIYPTFIRRISRTETESRRHRASTKEYENKEELFIKRKQTSQEKDGEVGIVALKVLRRRSVGTGTGMGRHQGKRSGWIFQRRNTSVCGAGLRKSLCEISVLSRRESEKFDLLGTLRKIQADCSMCKHRKKAQLWKAWTKQTILVKITASLLRRVVRRYKTGE